MAISSATAWEVRATGNDANGGGYKTGASGTDYSQQDAPQLSVTDGVTVGTALSSVTGGFTAAMIGNILNIDGVGRFEITAHTDTNNVTLDSAPGDATGLTVKVGGAFATMMPVLDATGAAVAGNTVYCKGTIDNQDHVDPNVDAAEPLRIKVIGYGTTRGDGVKCTWQNSAGNGYVLIHAASGYDYKNIIFDATGGNGKAFATDPGGDTTFENCEFNNADVTGALINYGAGWQFINCTATGNGGYPDPDEQADVDAGFAISNDVTDVALYRCRSFENTGNGFYVNGTLTRVTFVRCIAHDNTCNGFSSARYMWMLNCSTYNNGANGVVDTSGEWLDTHVYNCLFISNGMYGARTIATSFTDTEWGKTHFKNNAYYGNTSGATSNLPAGENDVTLTGNPYTDAAGADFTLNDTAGAGLAAQGAAV